MLAIYEKAWYNEKADFEKEKYSIICSEVKIHERGNPPGILPGKGRLQLW